MFFKVVHAGERSCIGAVARPAGRIINACISANGSCPFTAQRRSFCHGVGVRPKRMRQQVTFRRTRGKLGASARVRISTKGA